MGRIQAALDALAKRTADGAPPGLMDAVPGLTDAVVWGAPWSALESPRRLSARAPIALVSLIGFKIVGAGLTAANLGRLAPAYASVRVPPFQRAIKEDPRLTCDVEVAVTLLMAGGGGQDRAADLASMVEAVLLVMLRHALTDIDGVNLDTDKLRQAGLSAFAATGRRDIEIAPANDARRDLPSRVDVVRGLTRQVVYPSPDC